MNRKIKLIWDFKGEDAKAIAEHHQLHLEEFGLKEHLPILSSGVEELNSIHFIAFLIVNETQVIIVRDALLPHRAEIIE